jgi:hypothetical protein
MFQMIAILFGGNTVGVPQVRKCALTAVGEAEHLLGKAVDDARLQDAVEKTRAKDFVTRLFGAIGRRLERRRLADIDLLNRPLSLDEAWAGGWYGRSRVLQEGLLRGSANTGRKLNPEPKNWDDRLD